MKAHKNTRRPLTSDNHSRYPAAGLIRLILVIPAFILLINCPGCDCGVDSGWSDYDHDSYSCNMADTIKGQVSEWNNGDSQPIAGVQVSFGGARDTTDDSGNYVLTGIAKYTSGRYLIAQKEGYEIYGVYIKPYDFAGTGTRVFDIFLKRKL